MLKNAPTLAIVAVDTAENGPSKVRQVTNTSSQSLFLFDFHFGFILRAAASIWGSIPPWPSAGNETERGSRRKRAVNKKQCGIAKKKNYRKKKN